MELFYSRDIDGSICRLDKDESAHCIKVLRHRCGDEIHVIDGEGTLYHCELTDDNWKGAEALVKSQEEHWGSHPYRLTLAVCPTKNLDRYEWCCEKACEVGMDCVVPVIGEHSERKVFKKERISKILVSASKQSLKAAIPEIADPMSVKDFIRANGTRPEVDATAPEAAEAVPGSGNPLKLIAYCFEDETHPRTSIKEALARYEGREIIVLIGPEGDFSHEEAALALEQGFIPVHLGTSRLRTETAALTAAEAVYFRYM